ncbi:MAG: acyltransferase domain-containing protein [Ignavibacteria bacterium]|jgi:acyl transferase domain-containing protein/acyl carrier protein|nr:acyltransferase domain-containing protein [Ignavibacteria bacterium]
MSDNKPKIGRIAIIGMDCRVPGATNISEFWDNLMNGKDSIVDFTKEELLASGETIQKINSPNYVARGGTIEGLDEFDASFFGFTPREAELLDPQHRLFLECCWHSLEDAGYAERESHYRIGVFGGAGTSWYLNDVYNNPSVKKFADATSIVTATAPDYLATRVSYKLNLTGPSLDIQSACSSAMASIVLGIQSLLTYQTDMILAGGSSAQYPPNVGYVYASGGLESADGVCRPFDKDANGTLFSKGCGVVLLKRLEDAISDNDHIYAVISSGAVNNDGNRKVGYTAPSIEGQKEVMWETLELAGVSAEEITMVEAHGTATPIGDPMEVSSLTEAFRHYTTKKQYCALGSVKSNVGHLDTASGAVAVIKTALALKYGKIPASINYTEANPKIDFPNSPFFVNTVNRDWNTEGKRIALVNSFGVGGTNACLIMEEPPPPKQRTDISIHKECFIPISAMQKETLDKYFNSLTGFLQSDKNTKLNDISQLKDIAYTSLIGRKHYKYRGFVTFKDYSELLARLNSPTGLKNGVIQRGLQSQVFMFPGQGNQFVNMGKDLYDNYPVYKQVIDGASTILLNEIGQDIREILYPKENNIEEANKLIDQTYITQPAIFITSYALFCLLNSWGIEPKYLIGHSVGEYVAGVASGIFSLSDALRAVAYRSKLIQELPGGAMVAVLLTEAELQPMLSPALSIAVINYKGLSVVSGGFSDIEGLERVLSGKKIFNKRLPTSHAFHSAMMEPMLEKFSSFFKQATLHKPQIPIISTVTGKLLTDDEALSPDYWVNQVRNTVRFSDAVITALEKQANLFIEVGPGQSLESAVKRHTESVDIAAISTMRVSINEISDTEYLTSSIGSMWANGVSIDFERYFKGEDRRRTPFPLYPYNRKSYIIKNETNSIVTQEDDETKNTNIAEWMYIPTWKRTAQPGLLLEQYFNLQKDKDNKDIANTWLILGNELGLTDAICKLLDAMNEKYTLVNAGTSFKQIDTNRYAVNPIKKEDYLSLLSELSKIDKTPNRVLHLWNIQTENTTPNLVQCQSEEEIAFYAPLYLEQAFIECNLINNLNILFVVNDVFSIGGELIKNPLKALAIGPARCLNSEYRAAFAKFVDISISIDNTESLAKQLIAETQFRNDDRLIAYRKNGRWTEDYEQVIYPATEFPPHIFKDDGVYLITGGTGGLGLEFAKYISKHAKSNIFLTYRTPLPDRSDWNNYIMENPADITSEKIKIIQQIESTGSIIHLFKAEASNYDQMKELKDFIYKKFGKCNGVLHSAGAVGGGIIALKTEQMANDVLQAKTKGTLIIDELFGIDKLDFVVYFSSITAILGEASRIDYTSANAFLDNYASYRNQIKPNSAISINWDSWEKVGMAARWEETQALARKKLYLNEQSYKMGIHLIETKGTEEIYQIGFDERNDWVYKEHIVYNKPTIVGTFLINILSEFAKLKYGNELKDGDAIVLTDLYFLKPIQIARNEHPNIRLFTIKENDRIKVSICTLTIHKTSDKWDTMAMAYVSIEPRDNNVERTIDVARAIKDFDGEVITKQMFAIATGMNGQDILRYGKRWINLNLTQSYKKDNEYIICQKVANEHLIDISSFIINPAIFDSSTANLFQYYTTEPFLPFNYKKIKVYANRESQTAETFAFIKVVNPPSDEAKTTLMHFKVYNSKGELIVDVEDYNLIRIVDVDTTKKEKMEKVVITTDDYIYPEEGITAFERIMAYPYDTNIIVSPYNLHKSINTAREDANEKIEKESTATTYDRPELSSDYNAPTNEIEETLSRIWGQVLGIGQIGINDNFYELGGNSLLVVQLISNISGAFDIQLPVDIFKDSPTIAELASSILDMLIQDIDESELSNILDEIE